MTSTERPPAVVRAEAVARGIALTGQVMEVNGRRWWLTPHGHGLFWDRETGVFEFRRGVASMVGAKHGGADL